MLRIVLHLVGALQFTYSVYYDYAKVHVPIDMANGSKVGGKFIFLTFWTAIIQAIFFWLCLANDFLGTNLINPKCVPTIRRIKDSMYCTIVFPLSAFVSLTFWGLYAIDRELIFPKFLDLYFPNWLNHVMHTNILIFTLVELVSSFRAYPSRKEGLIILTSFMLVYLMWTIIIYAKSGEWVYPILQVLNWPQRLAFFLVLLLLIHSLYLLGEFLNGQVWGCELKSTKVGRIKSVKKKIR